MGKFFEALQKSDKGKATPKPSLVTDSDVITDDETSPYLPDEAEVSDREEVPDRSTGPESLLRPPLEAKQRPAIETNLAAPRPAYHFDKNLIAYHSPQSFEAEQFRMLRTNILFPSGGKPSPRTILVTSALPGEGKSFVASNLALTIAQNIDKHVLLIDCDMRRPTVHKIFGYENLPGLSNYLMGDATLPDLLIRTGNNHLSILPGGPAPSNPAELLSSNRMLALLREVRSRYDDRYIIIDSPPPHLTAESKALGQFVDGIIVVVKFGRTSRDLISELVDKFQKDKILGVVANWMDKGSTYLYGKGKYSQYNYYGSEKPN